MQKEKLEELNNGFKDTLGGTTELDKVSNVVKDIMKQLNNRVKDKLDWTVEAVGKFT